MHIDEINNSLTKAKYDYLTDYQIHKISFLESNRAGVDDFGTALEEVFRLTDDKKQLRLMIEIKNMLPPLAYLQNRSKEINKKYPGRDVKAAVIYPAEASIFLPLFSTLVKMLRASGQTRFFKLEQYDDARRWLTESRD